MINGCGCVVIDISPAVRTALLGNEEQDGAAAKMYSMERYVDVEHTLLIDN